MSHACTRAALARTIIAGMMRLRTDVPIIRRGVAVWMISATNDARTLATTIRPKPTKCIDKYAAPAAIQGQYISLG